MSLLNYIKPVTTIKSDDVRNLTEGKKPGETCLLDVRYPDEYDQGHIPGAILIPLPELKNRLDTLNREIPTICYCAVGGRSHAAASILQDAGFKKVYNMKGGFKAWRGVVAKDNPEDGKAIFDGLADPKQVLLLVWSMEEGSRRFYEKMSDAADNSDARALFLKLSQAEASHQRLITDLFHKISGLAPDSASPFYSRFLTDDPLKNKMENLMNVDEVLEWAQTHPLTEILEFCIRMEAKIYDIYSRLMSVCQDPGFCEIYSRLADEEKAHLDHFSELVYGKSSL